MIDYKWRAVQPDDLAVLEALDWACLQADGPASIPSPSYRDLLAVNAPMLCATLPSGHSEIVTVGWIQTTAAQVRIGGKVHPDHRRHGLGTQLLTWAEAQAHELSPDTPLIIRNEALNEASAALYAKQGFRVDFVENWMQRDLQEPIPVIDRARQVENWTVHNSRQFYEVYHDAFKERPGFPGISADEWISDNADDPDFQPELSLIAFVEGIGSMSVGFITAGELTIADLDQTVGWISQVGVRPGWRGQGIAAGLITRVMAACQREGYPAVGLHVNVNNPSAIRVYEQLGFKLMGQRTKYSKPIQETGPLNPVS